MKYLLVLLLFGNEKISYVFRSKTETLWFTGTQNQNTTMIFLELICLLASIIFCSQLIIFGTVILFPLFLMLAVNGTTSDVQGRN